LSDLISSRGIQGSAAKQALLEKARSVDPTFSENVNKQRYTFKQEWNNANGKSYNTRNAINTAMGHAADLLLAAQGMTKLNAGVLTLTGNKLLNFLDQNKGEGSVIQFNYIRSQLASEIATVYNGGNQPGQEEVQRNVDTLNAALSAGGIKELLDTAVSLLNSKISSTAGEYYNVMGKYPDEPVVQPQAVDTLQQAGADISPIIKTEMKQGYFSDLQESAKKMGYSDDDLINAISVYGIDATKQFFSNQ
jgi:hypothetical protein